MFNLENIIRENIKSLKPYSSARDEFHGEAGIFLDANENSLGSSVGNYHRYPDPMQLSVKQKIADIKSVTTPQIFLGNGSDECIDILFRCFCRPGRQNVIICPPTYGMYEVSAGINDVEVRRAPLNASLDLEIELIKSKVDADTRLIFICSPNNPTGNILNREVISELLQSFNGLVVVDEAYIDFAGDEGWLPSINNYPNLVVLQTFSKAWGLAALRMGMAFASPEIIQVMNKVKPPYNINGASQEIVSKALKDQAAVNERIDILCIERERLAASLAQLEVIEAICPSAANFLLVEVNEGDIYSKLVAHGIVARDRTSVMNGGYWLRITVGAPQENDRLIEVLQKIKNQH